MVNVGCLFGKPLNLQPFPGKKKRLIEIFVNCVSYNSRLEVRNTVELRLGLFNRINLFHWALNRSSTIKCHSP